MKRSGPLALTTTLALLLSAPGAHADGETIAVFTKNQTNPFFEAICAGARAAAASMGGKGNLIMIEGTKGSISSNTPGKGMKDALPLYPNITLLASQPANMQRMQALQVMENLLQAYPKIDGVLAANDAIATGVIDALPSAGRTALVTCMNGSQEAADAIKAGTMVSSGVADPFAQGCYGVIIAIKTLRHESTPPEILLKPVVADKSDLHGIDVPLDKRTCPTL